MTRGRPGAAAALATVVLAAAGLGACGGGGHRAGTNQRGRVAGTTHPAEPPGGLSLARSVAQLFAVGFAGTNADTSFVGRLRARGWGVVVVHGENVPDRRRAAALARALAAAGRADGGRAPLLAGGPATLPGTRPAPEPSLTTSAAAHADAARTGRALRAAGIRLALAPDADLGIVAGPAAGRAFSDDPATVAQLSAAAVAGYAAAGVASAAAHFPGEGAASRDPSEGVATVGLALPALRRADLRPFVAIAAAKAPVIQVSDAVYAAFDGVTPASLLPAAYELLRTGTHFGGVAMTGDLTAATAATGGTVAAAAVDALKAGADLLYVPGDAAHQDEAYAAVLAAVRSNRIPPARFAEALAHVLALKRAYGGR